MSDTLRIGTRGSKLALWQANYVKDMLQAVDQELEVSIEVIHTTGDRILDVALSKVGDKGLFTKELEQALLDERVDVCVHSCKDMPTVLPESLIIAGMPIRADARDVLIDFSGCDFASLPAGARVATGSLRRTAQLRALRPDIELCEIRGNVDTRIEKVRAGQFDALVLAAAGVLRMGLASCIVEYFSPQMMIPAVGQGAIAIETRRDDPVTRAYIERITDARTMCCVQAERSIMRELEGGCQVPIGAYASFLDAADTTQPAREETLVIDAFVSSLDGSRMLRATARGAGESAQLLASQVTRDLIDKGALAILEEIR